MKAGCELYVNDLNKDAVAELVAAGAKEGDYETIGKECDIVLMILPNGAIVQSVLFGENGLAGYLKPGTVVCDMSSVTPTESCTCAEKLAEMQIGFVDSPVSGGEPKAIDGTLAFMAGGNEADFEKLRGEFFVDDHQLWNQEIPPQKMMERQKEWKEENEKLQTKMETFAKEASEDAEALAEQVRVENRTRYDYKKFLRKFSVLKEEIQVDPDTFDYIFYHYGMEMFENVPLIEPQETKEVHKVEDFVIAVDTSMSCKEELIRKFLEQTYSVLSESESFFRKICVHIIQCDDKVQSDVVIHNQEEMERYMEQFEIHGFGGTDFRPVFGYVNELIAKKAFRRLRGLIYFTDGYGTFPAKKPLYETAFVFLKEDYSDVDVPAWAMKLILEPEQLRRTEGEMEYGY